MLVRCVGVVWCDGVGCWSASCLQVVPLCGVLDALHEPGRELLAVQDHDQPRQQLPMGGLVEAGIWVRLGPERHVNTVG